MTVATNDLALMRALVDCASAAARAAGAVALERFAQVQEVTQKEGGMTGNIVTEVDLLAEAEALRRIRAEFPEHNVISEESPAEDRQSRWTWVIDPIDGTLNYAYGLANWCVSIGVLHDGVPQVGVIYDPVRDELYTAAPGLGAALNGAPIAPVQRNDLAYALVGFDLGYFPEARQQLTQAALAVLPHAQALRLSGSAALSLANVAAGRFGAYFHLSLFQWDLAAALSLLRETGVVATTWNGQPATPTGRQIVAAPPGIHERLRRILLESLTAQELRS